MTRVVVPAVGLLAVTTALALVGIAPIVLFPASQEAGPHEIAPSASSEVATVTAPALTPNGGSGPAATAAIPKEPAKAGPIPGAPTAGPNPAGGGGTTSPPEQPVDQPEQPDGGQPDGGQPDGGQPDKVARPGGGTADEGENLGEPDHDNGSGKQKTKKGKALGHSKDKAKGKAKGHEKWQGQAPVASPPHGAKPGHAHPAPADRHSGRGHRPHPRSGG